MSNANQPAFANPGNVFSKDDIQNGSDGLTKREFFAAMAMQGLLGNPAQESGNLTAIAISALKAADALLKQLEP